MIYRFYNDAGECREVVASMKTPPPLEETIDGVRWIRMIEMPSVCVPQFGRGSVRPLGNGALPVSRSLPRAEAKDIIGKTRIGEHVVCELKGGGYCNEVGQRIVDNQKSRDRHLKSTGFVEYED